MDRKNPDIDTQAIFEQARAGVPAAQGEIVRLIQGLSRAACAGGGLATSDIEWEDVAQEASRRFFVAGVQQFRKPGSEKNFLYTIVRSALIQIIRSEARRRVREEKVTVEQVVPPHDPAPKLTVSRILERIPEGCSDILTRVFLRGEPYSMLARDLGMLESSVRTKVTRCLKRARQVAQEGSRP